MNAPVHSASRLYDVEHRERVAYRWDTGEIIVKHITLASCGFGPFSQSCIRESAQAKCVQGRVYLFPKGFSILFIVVSQFRRRAFQLVHCRVAVRTQRNSNSSDWGVPTLIAQVFLPIGRDREFSACIGAALCTGIGHTGATPSRAGKSEVGLSGRDRR